MSSQQVILNHDGFILGVPSSELQGPGVYEVEDGHVLSFAPLAATLAEASSQAASDASPGVAAAPVQVPQVNGG